MRVSESSKVNLVVSGLNKSSLQGQKITEQIASGKKINRPSDNPAASAKIEAYKADIAKNEIAVRNAAVDRLWLDTVDASTEQMVESLRYAKVKALEAANSYHSTESWAAIAAEVEAIQKQLFDLGNTQVNDVYIYGGSKTFSPPLANGWPYQLPGINEITGLYQSSETFDQYLLQNLKADADFEEAAKPIDIEFSTNFIESQPDEQNNSANNNPYQLYNVNDSAYGYKVTINRQDRPQQVIDKLNDALAAKYNYQLDPTFPSGYKQDGHFYLGSDNKLYAQTLPNAEIGFSSSFTDNIKMQPAPTSQAVILSDGQQASGYFGEFVSGFGDRDILLRITVPGPIGQAQYSVSDDNGQTWSVNRQLLWENELYNSDGQFSTHMNLNFMRRSAPIFLPEGLEFKINANPSVTYQGNDFVRQVPLDGQYKSNINITAKELFFSKNDTNSVNSFDILTRLNKNIKLGLIDEIAKDIDNLDTAIDQVLLLRAQSGIKTKDLELADERIQKNNIDASTALSELEDADLAKLATDLSLNDVQKQAMMETSARLLQPSLVQFLR